MIRSNRTSLFTRNFQRAMSQMAQDPENSRFLSGPDIVDELLRVILHDP